MSIEDYLAFDSLFFPLMGFCVYFDPEGAEWEEDDEEED